MTSRERVALALDHQEPDRIPVDFWASKGTWRKIETSLGLSQDQFLDEHDVDFRYIAGPEYVGPPLDADTDIWGVGRTTAEVRMADGVEHYAEVTDPPLAGATTVDDIERYDHWPSPDWFRYDDIGRQCDDVIGSGRVAVFMGDRLNRVAQLKPAMYLRGVEQILVDMAMQPEIARAVFAKVRVFYAAYLERILDAAGGKIDIVLSGDDFGSQAGPLISPAMWDEFIREGFAAFIGMVRAAGAKSMHHTCGSVVPIIPKMIDCGLDVLQSLQPEAAGMAPESLKAAFGGRLCFQGGVCIQKTMPFGGRDAIREQVRRLAETMGAGGGYVFCTSHNIQADTPMENIQALMDAYAECGVYRPAP